MAALPVPFTAHAQGAPTISVRSTYTLDRYGFATVNESVRFANNGSASVPIPSLTIGFGNLTSMVAQSNLTGAGFTLNAASAGGPFQVSSSGSVQGGGNATFTLSVLLDGVVSTMKNGSLQVMTLSSPSIDAKVDSLFNVVRMPTSTAFNTAPSKLKASLGGTNNTYWSSATGTTPSAVTSVRVVTESNLQNPQDFNPLRVFSAQRTITVAANGSPTVTDTLEFQNMGTVPLASLRVSLLAPSTTKVTVLPGAGPRLVNPVTLPLQNGAIQLGYFASGYPNPGVAGGANFTISYQYPLGPKFYSTSGGQVTLSLPDTPPIRAFVDSYAISLSVPLGTSAPRSAPTVLSNVTPWQGGATTFSYALAFGWGVEAGVPAASVIFLLLLIGLFVSRTTTAQAEETEEEESSTELTSTMIKAFEEKTNLINSLWPEIEGKDPNEVDKDYFDELRGRLDTFRSRALQRLNEARQRSSSQRFSDVLNQMQATEREVDRAAKDKLNLYQQYYMRQMRKEVYERLLPQYTKRLEKALNQLSDELHNVQREAKLL